MTKFVKFPETKTPKICYMTSEPKDIYCYLDVLMDESERVKEDRFWVERGTIKKEDLLTTHLSNNIDWFLRFRHYWYSFSSIYYLLSNWEKFTSYNSKACGMARGIACTSSYVANKHLMLKNKRSKFIARWLNKKNWKPMFKQNTLVTNLVFREAFPTRLLFLEHLDIFEAYGDDSSSGINDEVGAEENLDLHETSLDIEAEAFEEEPNFLKCFPNNFEVINCAFKVDNIFVVNVCDPDHYDALDYADLDNAIYRKDHKKQTYEWQTNFAYTVLNMDAESKVLARLFIKNIITNKKIKTKRKLTLLKLLKGTKSSNPTSNWVRSDIFRFFLLTSCVSIFG